MRWWQSSNWMSVWRPAVAALLLCSAGCTETMTKMSPSNIWHNMQPHRLQKLNSGTGMSSDVYYSISDNIPADPFEARDSQHDSN